MTYQTTTLLPMYTGYGAQANQSPIVYYSLSRPIICFPVTIESVISRPRLVLIPEIVTPESADQNGSPLGVSVQQIIGLDRL